MENLNAEQIKKALECCTRGRKSEADRPCLDCHYNECNLVGGTCERQTTGTCQGWLMKDALALINSQEQKNKELTEDLHATRTELTRAQAENAKYEAENHAEFNKWLKLEEATKRHHAELFEEAKIVVKADTVRELQKRFKEKVEKFLISPAFQYQANNFIDQVAEEVIKNNNGKV